MKQLDPYSIVIALNHLSDVVNQTSQSNIIKDYLMPILIVFLSSGTAYLIAQKGFRWQESAKNEKEKADTSNKLLSLFQLMQGLLAAIKVNYQNELQSNPIQRAMVIPVLAERFPHMDIEMEKLIQVLYTTPIDQKEEPWSNISSIMSTLSNFNQLVEIIKTRNIVDERVRSKLADKLQHPHEEMKTQRIIEIAGHAECMRLVDLTEMLILFVDNLIITVDDFLRNYPTISTRVIKMEYLINYTVIQDYRNDSESFSLLINRCVDVDFAVLAKIMGLSEIQVKKKYTDKSFMITTKKNLHG
ncbi:hypothetical protein [Serratia marcescens]|uniref:hypothetical protein n=1 Tax=Serratia marcescens TaxID=615 RepID=UPI000E015FA8|nr:hypothetical protein [Serratia marcescens]SUI37452.1 Uncharacterised protein [Serratia marcescens]